mmetsp:Transcript_9332/g.36445  ORF Transcript_9332/g.36445 Transcript_9332/m.36445 type:complete len:238 (-) Transcript_9332:388-1101(-)
MRRRAPRQSRRPRLRPLRRCCAPAAGRAVTGPRPKARSRASRAVAGAALGGRQVRPPRPPTSHPPLPRRLARQRPRSLVQPRMRCRCRQLHRRPRPRTTAPPAAALAAAQSLCPVGARTRQHGPRAARSSRPPPRRWSPLPRSGALWRRGAREPCLRQPRTRRASGPAARWRRRPPGRRRPSAPGTGWRWRPFRGRGAARAWPAAPSTAACWSGGETRAAEAAECGSCPSWSCPSPE